MTHQSTYRKAVMNLLKTSALLPALTVSLLLSACSGSEAYRGEWKAMAPDGSKAEISFAEKSFTVKDGKGAQTVYEYTQNEYQYENGRTSYGIDIKNSSEMLIIFPFKGNETRAAMTAPDNTLIYTLDRNNYVPVQEFWKLPR